MSESNDENVEVIEYELTTADDDGNGEVIVVAKKPKKIKQHSYVVVQRATAAGDDEQEGNDNIEILQQEDSSSDCIVSEEEFLAETETPLFKRENEIARFKYEDDDDIQEPSNDDLEEQEEEEENNHQNEDKTKGPRRFLLFDGLVAAVVDYDEDDGAPIVEFSMNASEDDQIVLPVECGICPDIMHKSKLDKHMAKHLKFINGIKRFLCIYCDENFVSRAYAAGHARRHMGIRPYVCEACKLYYCTKQDLRVHEQRRHWAKNFICKVCKKPFSQKNALTNHQKRMHEEAPRFECVHCNKRFQRNYAMKEHIRTVHFGNRRPLDCPFCDMRFNDTHKLAKHRKDKHLQQSNFECRLCGLEFTSISFFDAHRRSLQCRRKYKDREEQLHNSKKKNEPINITSNVVIKKEVAQKKIENDTDNVGPQILEIKKQSEVTHSDGREEVLYEITLDNL